MVILSEEELALHRLGTKFAAAVREVWLCISVGRNDVHARPLRRLAGTPHEVILALEKDDFVPARPVKDI